MKLTNCPRSLSDLKGDEEFSSANKPLLNLELDHIIPDELHLMLRVTDRLIKALMHTAQSYDKHQHRLQCIRHAYKVINGPLMTKLIAAIRQCGVSFKVFEDEESGKVEWTSLLGPDKLKFLKQLPAKLADCQPPEMVPSIQKLWEVHSIVSYYLHYLCLLLRTLIQYMAL